MADAELRPATYILIHERSPQMPILYASSSIRQALLYEPHEFIGRSPLEYVVDTRDIEDIKEHHAKHTDDNVIMTHLFLKSKIDAPVFIHTIAFTCGNVDFHMARSYPNMAADMRARTMDVKRFKCLISEDASSRSSSSSSNSEAEASGAGVRGRGQSASTTYSMRSANQACIVLEDMNAHAAQAEADADAGPNIVFATDSINRILDVDSCDIQGEPFLSLVAPEDSERASRYLEGVLSSNELVLETLSLLVNPVEESHLDNPRVVSVEFMGMGSDDGAIMLCQLERPGALRRDVLDGYMSLEEIISSGPETSDFPEAWNGAHD